MRGIETPHATAEVNRKRSTSLSASSPITSARFRSQSLTESFHQTKVAVTFCVAFLRRAVRYGRTLGFHEPFFFKLVDVVAKTMGDVFPEVRAKQSKIKETIRREEEAFNKTLDKGIELFEAIRRAYVESERRVEPPLGSRHLRGSAFKLYDTYGFPLDLTELMARERGLTVDVAGFEKLMDEQRERARKAQKKEEITC